MERGEHMVAEAGAMTYMDPSIEVHTAKKRAESSGHFDLFLIRTELKKAMPEHKNLKQPSAGKDLK